MLYFNILPFLYVVCALLCFVVLFYGSFLAVMLHKLLQNCKLIVLQNSVFLR